MEPPAAKAFAKDAAVASESPAHMRMHLKDDERLKGTC